MTVDSGIVLSGLVFGLSAGASPGPLLTLVISETLINGTRAGTKVALAPLITDLPILLAGILLLSRLAHLQPVLGIIALAGSAYLIYLGWESLTFTGVGEQEAASEDRSLQKGVLANFLNPNPYIFWFSIGGPTVIRAMDGGGLPLALAFLVVFYFLLVGTKVLVAVVVGRSRRFLQGRLFVWINRCLGILLLVYAGVFLMDAVGHFSR